MSWIKASLAAALAVPAAFAGEESARLAIDSMTPSTIRAGSSDLILRVRGRGFTDATILRWNGSDRVTAVLGPDSLSAMILSSDLAEPGQGQVIVFDPQGGSSQALGVVVRRGSLDARRTGHPNPTPRVLGFSPPMAAAGSGRLKMTVRGEGFTPFSAVRWRGAPRRTRFISGATLEAELLSEDVATSGIGAVTVRNPLPGGGISAPVWFVIHANDGATPDRPKIYPNPWRADAHQGLRISFENLARRSIIKILTTTGAGVKTISASTGAGEWDLTNESGHPVSGGAYMYMISDGKKIVEGKLKISR